MIRTETIASLNSWKLSTLRGLKVGFRLTPVLLALWKNPEILPSVTRSYAQNKRGGIIFATQYQQTFRRLCFLEVLSMKKLCGLLAISISLMIVVYTPVALAQAQAQAPAEKVFEGTLTKVDASAHSLSIKGATGAEMTFNYTDQTQVLGPEKNIQGLAGKPGARLKVTYSEQGGKLTATKIESVEKS
jgi:hypothetical protein